MHSTKDSPDLIKELNDKDVEKRLDAMQKIANSWNKNEENRPKSNPVDVNNHIHTTYSFSPYSPSKAIYMSAHEGLSTSGIIDHDSISGAEEFIKAGKIARLPVTIGWEMRISLEGTPFADKRINNPDQIGIAYVTVHGLPHSQIPKVAYFLKPINIARGERNKKMLANINKIIESLNISLDYEKDVVASSMALDGGGVTERHLLFALSNALIKKYGKGEHLLDIISNKLKLKISSSIKKMLLDEDNLYYTYDLLGLLKSEMVSNFYIDAQIDECIPVLDYISFIKTTGAVSCGAYLGDVGDSITGDKKTQKFEDDYIEDLFAFYSETGFEGISYMPSRNTDEQIKRVRDLAAEHSLIQISGEDINQPRQPFICEKARDKKFEGLIETTWALIGNEFHADSDLDNSIVSLRSKTLYPDIENRIAAYAKIGRDSIQNKSLL